MGALCVGVKRGWNDDVGSTSLPVDPVVDGGKSVVINYICIVKTSKIQQHILHSPQQDGLVNNQVVALILARGGSKGIPLKNLAKLNSESLLQRTLEVINKSGLFENVWVSTDHPLIAVEANKFNASVFRRSEEFSR